MAFLDPLLGSKPRTPPLVKVDAAQVQKDAIAGNLAALPEAEVLGGRVNDFTAQQIQRMYASVLPGYEQIQSKISQNILSQVSGELPQDVSAAVSRRSAGQALYGGFGGSGAARNLEARDLGLTRLGIQEAGMTSAQRWLQMGRSPQYDITSTFLGPGDLLQHVTGERDKAWDVKNLKRQISAMPEPWGQQLMSDLGAASSMAGMYAGGGSGGGGGGDGGGES